MNAFWENRRNEVLRLRDQLTSNIFGMAQAKILFAYIAIGIVITIGAGYLVYRNTIYFTQDIISKIQVSLGQQMLDHATTTEARFAGSITQVINAEILKVNIVIGIFMLVVLSISAYVLARITLRPIRRAMDRQRRFAANVAHELRTPLSVMRTNFEVTLMEANGDISEELKNNLKSSIEEIDRMSAITKFLLAFFSYDGRLSEMEFSNIDLVAIVRETLALMKPFIGKREVDVRAASFNKNIFVRGNQTAIQEMLMNLIKNAVAYTPAHGSVIVSANINHGLPTLSVKDTGIGIPTADLPHIFEPFFRGENAYSQRSKKRGSGLGLAIVKEIATLHRATISVKGDIGQGTTFFIHFPVARVSS